MSERENGILIGLAALPVLIIAAAIAWGLLLLLTRLLSALAVGSLLLTPPTPSIRRDVVAISVGAAQRAWLVGVGGLGVAVWIGNDPRRQADLNKGFVEANSVNIFEGPDASPVHQSQA